MGTFLSLLIPALVPAMVDGARGLFGRIFGTAGAMPQNFEDAIKWEEMQIKKLTALAQLDAPAGNISQWVADLRASSRYILAGLIIVGTFGALLTPNVDKDMKELLLQLAGSVFAFMFGDRMYLGITKRK